MLLSVMGQIKGIRMIKTPFSHIKTGMQSHPYFYQFSDHHGAVRYFSVLEPVDLVDLPAHQLEYCRVRLSALYPAEFLAQ